MEGPKMLMALVMVSACICLAGKPAGAQIHHVVGGDRGWDPATNVSAWSDGKIFRVGDKIWLTYSAAQGNVLELKTHEEFHSCDLSNPMRTFMDGLDNILLEGEGMRYFASSNHENCKGGLKLHVDVLPQLPRSQAMAAEGSGTAAAEAPAVPSEANPARLGGKKHSTALPLLAVMSLCFVVGV